MKRITLLFLTFLTVSLIAKNAMAHPHVFLEANLEVVKDKQGNVSELRQVWRFDELFTASVILDFDTDGNGAVENEELAEVEKIIKENLKEFDYYTAVRHDNKIIDFDPPKIFHVDFENDQILMILAIKLRNPLMVTGKQFAVSISDPTYYVAAEIEGKKSIEFTDPSTKCDFEIERPDFNALYEKNPEVFSDDFQGSDDPNVFSADEYLTWVNFNC